MTQLYMMKKLQAKKLNYKREKTSIEPMTAGLKKGSESPGKRQASHLNSGRGSSIATDRKVLLPDSPVRESSFNIDQAM